uniref:Tr-type G domain-containing protein n=1 Tax=Piliocolobus tephrosceles TaxID=591936 RepID=A0A8C9IM71_9PRIM
MLKQTINKFLLKYNKRFFSYDLVNLGILAHIDAGKTTISEDILYNANEIRVKGNINDQNTQLDFLKQERERGITIKTAYSCFKWNNVIVNLIDTPGHVDFSNETFLSLCVSDKCVIVVDAKEGLEIQTINIFRYIKENIPIYFFLNKMDIYETDIDYNFTSIKNNLSSKGLLITYPLYINKKLKFILDIPSMMLYYYPPVKYAQKIVYKKISLETVLKLSKWYCTNKNIQRHFSSIQSCKDTTEENNKQIIYEILNILNDDIVNYIIKKREEIIETLCDIDIHLLHTYLSNIKIEYDTIKSLLIKYINMKKVFPIFSGSALNSYGVHLLLDYVTFGTTDNSNSDKTINTQCFNINKETYVENMNHVNIKQNDLIHNRDKIKQTITGEMEKSIRNNKNVPTGVVPPGVIPTGTTVTNKHAYLNFCKSIIFIFKLVSEKNGYNTFCKVFKGKLYKNTKLYNIRNNKYEIVKSIYKVKADRCIMINELDNNDIGMIRGFENILVCDIMYEKEENEEKKKVEYNVQDKKTNKTIISTEISDYKFSKYKKKNDKLNDKYNKCYDPGKDQGKNQGKNQGQCLDVSELYYSNQSDLHDYNYNPNNDSSNENVVSFNEIYKVMHTHIEKKELWYFLKNYKKRISKNIIVCTCTIKPTDSRKEKELKQVLKNICLEDNSIVSYTNKNNQLVIGSIGILNIQVTLDKIKSDYNIDLKTDDVEIIQKEYVVGQY